MILDCYFIQTSIKRLLKLVKSLNKYVFNDVPLGESLQARDAIQMPQKSQEGLYCLSPTILFKYLF